MRLTRRLLIAGLGTTAVVAVGVAALPYLERPARGVDQMSPIEAHAAAQTGDILLIDIRRPDEWRRTGIPEGAVPIDMRRPDFIQAVRTARRKEQQPIALICARGVRSNRLSARLGEAGLTRIIDVPEGMMGSFAGPGWLARDLPVVAWTG